MANEIVKHGQVDIDSLSRVAKMMALSGYFDAKGDTAQSIAKIGVAILAGREMGIGEFASVNGIHIINGKPTMSANLMASRVKAHPRYNYKVVEMSAENVSIDFYENGELIGNSCFGVKDAKAAGLTSGNWSKYPRNMLFARALSNGVRWYAPDVFEGSTVYTPDEMGADTNDNGNITNGGFTVVDPAPTSEPPLPVESLDDVSELDQNGPIDGDPPEEFDAIPPAQPQHKPKPSRNGGSGPSANGNGSSNPSGYFHAQGTTTFGPKWNELRPFIVQQYTEKLTGSVRSSSSDLTSSELQALAVMFKSERKRWQQWSRDEAEMPLDAGDYDFAAADDDHSYRYS